MWKIKAHFQTIDPEISLSWQILAPETAFWIFLDSESDSFLETEITRMVHILGPEIAGIWLFLEPEIAKWFS